MNQKTLSSNCYHQNMPQKYSKLVQYLIKFLGQTISAFLLYQQLNSKVFCHQFIAIYQQMLKYQSQIHIGSKYAVNCLANLAKISVKKIDDLQPAHSSHTGISSRLLLDTTATHQQLNYNHSSIDLKKKDNRQKNSLNEQIKLNKNFEIKNTNTKASNESYIQQKSMLKTIVQNQGLQRQGQNEKNKLDQRRVQSGIPLNANKQIYSIQYKRRAITSARLGENRNKSMMSSKSKEMKLLQFNQNIRIGENDINDIDNDSVLEVLQNCEQRSKVDLYKDLELNKNIKDKKYDGKKKINNLIMMNAVIMPFKKKNKRLQKNTLYMIPQFF